MLKNKLYTVIVCIFLAFSLNSHAEKSDTTSIKGLLGTDSKSNEPTFIDSDTLSLNSEARTFSYTGNVTVKRGDVTMTADRIEGSYNDKNEIQTITAYSNVDIVKATGIKAKAQKAVYDAVAETITLTDSPSVEQNGSILTADNIVMHLKTNKSEATGQVKVKLVKKEGAE